MRTSFTLVIVIALCAAPGCNKHAPLTDSPVSPTPPVSLTPPDLPPANQPDVSTINLAHNAVQAGNSLQGVVNILAPAPAAGATVALISTDSAAMVPATVRVAGGERSGAFTVTTRSVADDRHLTITARTAGRSAIAPLSIWSEAPKFYVWTSDADEYIGEGGVNRLHECCAGFTAVCDGNEVRIEIATPDVEAWSLRFKAPGGAPLRSGTYENATQAASGTNATMIVSGRDRACGTVNGRFTVREINLQDDRVKRFRVSFEQQCTNGDLRGWLQGEVGLTDMPASAAAVSCQR